MSTYAISLLTDRKLVIRIKKTCDISKYLLPNEIDWSSNQIKGISSMKVNNKSVSLDCITTYEKSKCLQIYNDEYKRNKNKETPDLFSIRTNKDWITSLSENKNFHEKILSIGFNSIEEFRFPLVLNKWYKRLFKLSPQTSIKYESIKKKAHLTNNNKIRKVNS